MTGMKKSEIQEKLPFFNRELSWIEFNHRVLDQALDPSNKPLERLKFLCIVSSNFDEFFMIRVAAIKRQLLMGNYISCPSGMSPEDQLTAISSRVKDVVSQQYRCLHEEVFPLLAKNGLIFVHPRDCSGEQDLFLKELFEREIFPVLTPVRVEGSVDALSLGNLKLHAAFLLKPQEGNSDGIEGDERLAFVQVPSSLPRIIFLPGPADKVMFTLLEYVVFEHAFHLFHGYDIKESILFRVARDADFGVDEEQDEDFVGAMEEVIVNRQHSMVVRLTVINTSTRLRDRLREILGLTPKEVYEHQGPLDLKSLMELSSVPGFDSIRDEKWKPCRSPDIPDDEPVWNSISKKDILLHHPFESFYPVVRFVNEAASDPSVLAIKATLYRTSGDSSIVQALELAARNGKQVTALVELKARFDEERNIGWAERLERAGVIVIYGIARLKVHAKALLVVRREEGGIKRYLHLGTGNYNDRTAKQYTDLGFFTCRDDLTYEASLFFNAITGYSAIPNLRKLVMAPSAMKNRILMLVEREASRSTKEDPGCIMAKMNSLADVDVIKALYRASQHGVKILLNVRGTCMLVPGIPGVSENITVVSIVDRYLEHARVFYFYNNGSEEVYCASADWMTRNLERRVELLFPVEAPELLRRIVKMLKVFFQDNVNAYVLNHKGTYRRKTPDGVKSAMRSQRFFYEEALRKSEETDMTNRKEFTVRRKPPRMKAAE